MTTALAVRAQAPDFSLTHTIGSKPVALSETLKGGPVVLLFFPLAFSGVCTAELCQMAEDYDRWREVGANVLGISTDSPFVNARFAKETNVQFPLLSDFNRDVMTAYGVRNDDFFGMKGVAHRSAFVIDTDGTIAYAWMNEDSDILPPFDEVFDAVQGLV